MRDEFVTVFLEHSFALGSLGPASSAETVVGAAVLIKQHDVVLLEFHNRVLAQLPAGPAWCAGAGRGVVAACTQTGDINSVASPSLNNGRPGRQPCAVRGGQSQV